MKWEDFRKYYISLKLKHLHLSEQTIQNNMNYSYITIQVQSINYINLTKHFNSTTFSGLLLYCSVNS